MVVGSILCPICDASVRGESGLALTRFFQDHLREAHGISRLMPVDPSMEGPHIPVEEIPGVVGSAMGERKREVFVPDSDSYGFGDKPLSAQRAMGIDVMCPLCGQGVRGSDEDDLQDRMKGHWADVHKIRPTIRAELGLSR
mgnify:CR=1 FL=1